LWENLRKRGNLESLDSDERIIMDLITGLVVAEWIDLAQNQ
jgi:hypothetical protein